MYKCQYLLCALMFSAYLMGMDQNTNLPLPDNLPTDAWVTIFNAVTWQSQLKCARTCHALKSLYDTNDQIYFDRGAIISCKAYADDDCSGMGVVCLKIATGKIRGSFTLGKNSEKQHYYFIDQLQHTYKHIRQLHIDSSTSFNDQHIAQLIDRLEKHTNVPLRSLTITQSSITVLTLLELTRCTYLEELDMSNNSNLAKERSTFAIPLSHMIRGLNKLKKLSMNNCQLDNPAISTLPDLLATNTHLEELSLSGNQITDSMKNILTAASEKAPKQLLKLNLSDQKES